MTGAVAAMAEPPQMEEPTPTRVATLPGIRIHRLSRKAVIRETEMVHKMMGRDCFPVCTTTLRFMPKPSRTTAHCSTFLETNFTPPSTRDLSWMSRLSTMPARMAMTAPPMMGKALPRNQDGTATARHRTIPHPFFFTKFNANPAPLSSLRPLAGGQIWKIWRD